MIPQSESRLRKAELEAEAAAEGTWRRRPTWRPTESSVMPDGPQTSVVTGRRDGARAERVSDWAEGRSWGRETWRVNMRTEREREGCNRSGWDTDSLVFSAFCWLVWILASRSSAKASFVLRFCWVSVSSSVADDNLRRVLDFKTLQILIWWCVCVFYFEGAHMVCRLSAVSVFHRMSLAGRLSVSSNNDVSNSTFVSGVSGDLRHKRTPLTQRGQRKHRRSGCSATSHL